ncbi:MAG: AMP-dependent synthetase [candidate division Zixibacteria bacterium RBG_16_53_22]|nr:MAG: AMP-dependent synthetase [candidate division Zixibacteria bacterium RBG_16_53_22]
MMFSPTLLHQFLTQTAKKFPDKTAIIAEGKRLTYRSLDTSSSMLARSLRRMGILRHDRVVVFLDNSPESVISLYGILKAGSAFVILNASMKAKKLAYILRDSGASALITHGNKAEVVAEAVRELPVKPRIVWVGSRASDLAVRGIESVAWDEAITAGGPDWHPPRCIDQDLAALIYTSGSTGEPKGVVSSHMNMVSAARSIIQYIGNTSDDIIVDVLPLSFDYGLYQVIMSVIFGGTVALESFFFPVQVLQCIEKERVTGLPLVPTVAAFLLKMKNLEKYDLRSLRYMTNTGAALPVEHIRKLRSLFPTVKVFSMFGLTECKRVCYLPPEEIDRRPASVGKAIPNCEVFILDENCREVAPGEIGELVIRGSNVMRGYWNAPDLTAQAYRAGRIQGEMWLYSGDFFRMDEEGFLYFLGRKDDMIKSKGERISPKEVENVLSEIPGVAEAAVIGVPDDILGQAIKAFIVRAPGSRLTEKDVLKACVESMETFMVPKYVEFVADLPKSAHGKIDKSALKSRTAV